MSRRCRVITAFTSFAIGMCLLVSWARNAEEHSDLYWTSESPIPLSENLNTHLRRYSSWAIGKHRRVLYLYRAGSDTPYITFTGIYLIQQSNTPPARTSGVTNWLGFGWIDFEWRFPGGMTVSTVGILLPLWLVAAFFLCGGIALKRPPRIRFSLAEVFTLITVTALLLGGVSALLPYIDPPYWQLGR